MHEFAMSRYLIYPQSHLLNLLSNNSRIIIIVVIYLPENIWTCNTALNCFMSFPILWVLCDVGYVIQDSFQVKRAASWRLKNWCIVPPNFNKSWQTQ